MHGKVWMFSHLIDDEDMETEVEVRCQDEIFKAKGKVVKQIGWKLFEECFKNEDGLAIENPADAGKDRIPKVEADHLRFHTIL